MKLKALAAIAVAGIMVMSVPMVALAETHTHTSAQDGHVKTNYAEGVSATSGTCNAGDVGSEYLTNASAIKASNESTVTADSATNKTVSSETGATVMADNATVTVNGSVTNKGSYIAIKAKNGATVEAGSVTGSGNYTVYTEYDNANQGTKVTKVTTGDVINEGIGNAIGANKYSTVTATNATNEGASATVYASGANASIVVTNDVTNKSTGSAIDARSDSNITAGSATNTSDSNATVYASGTGATVTITNDVTNNGNGYAVSVARGATVVVEGTVDSYHSSGTTASVDNNADTRLIVYEITNSKSENRKITGDGAVSNVYYIIKGIDSAGISGVTGTTNQTVLAGTADKKTYKTAKYKDVITFSVTSGYELKEGNIKVTPNADGTYSITIPVGGGVTLEAIKKAIEQAQSSGGGATFTKIPTSQGSASAPLTSGSWAQASEGKFTYTNNGEKLINCTAWIQYTDANGQVVTGKYCFDNNGYALVNTWKEVQTGVWNYFGADGKMVTNTTTPDGYVVDANGEWRK